MIRGKIDPGHVEGYNRGTCKNYYEGTQMYKLAVYEVEEFKKYADCDVTLTRGLRDFPSLYERALQARGYDFILSDHTNANSNADAEQVLIYRSLKRTETALNARLAKVIVDTMGTSYKVLTRADSKGNDYYGILRNPVNLGVKLPLLIEHGYHTNSKQCEWLMSDANLKLLARNKVLVIAEFYGLRLKTQTVVYYKKGNIGEGVRKLQEDLVELGYELSVDGSFGPGTYAVVRQFQTENKLTVDGLAGPSTLGKIEELIEIKNKAPELTYAPEGKIYRVQVSANSVREYAEETVKKLHVDGYDKAYIKLDKI